MRVPRYVFSVFICLVFLCVALIVCYAIRLDLVLSMCIYIYIYIEREREMDMLIVSWVGGNLYGV